MCWGGDSAGQLGDGTFEDSATPVTVPRLAGARAVSVSDHTCVVLQGGGIECWGGYAPDPATEDGTLVPAPRAIVDGVVGATAVATGVEYSCWLGVRGEVGCWTSGDDDAGGGPWHLLRQGWEAWPKRAKPTAIAGGSGHICVLQADGRVACWGENSSGQLGDGTKEDSVRPVDVLAVEGAIALAAGARHSCAVVAGGKVACWGDNNAGQLGNNVTTDASTPVGAVAGP